MGQSRRCNRTRRGAAWNEGARRLWGALVVHGMNREELANVLGTQRGNVTRWLYGDRRPEWPFRFELERLFGIAPRLFDAPAKPFTFPAEEDRPSRPETKARGRRTRAGHAA